MPFLVSPNILKQQAKSIVKHWPRGQIKTTRARLLLCQLYGFSDDHHYKKSMSQESGALFPLGENNVATLKESMEAILSIKRKMIENIGNMAWLSSSNSKEQQF